MKNHILLLGAHMSIEGGFDKAVERAKTIGCTTFQIFTKSNRQWRAKHISDESVTTFIEAIENSKIKKEHVFAHASYLINIASQEPELAQKSVHALQEELNRCAVLQIPYLILHPGSSSDKDRVKIIQTIARNLDYIFQNESHNTVTILLETMAGQGNVVGSSLEELSTILDLISPKTSKYVGICVDTCHIFASGYDIRTEELYNQFWEKCNTLIGLNLVKALHINDSKKGLGSCVDRHENIGKGILGKDSFRLLFNDHRFFDIPKILETPKTDLQCDLKNMQTLYSLLSDKTKHLFCLD